MNASNVLTVTVTDPDNDHLRAWKVNLYRAKSVRVLLVSYRGEIIAAHRVRGAVVDSETPGRVRFIRAPRTARKAWVVKYG